MGGTHSGALWGHGLGPIVHVSTLSSLLHEIFCSGYVFWDHVADVTGGNFRHVVAAHPKCRQRAKVLGASLEGLTSSLEL